MDEGRRRPASDGGACGKASAFSPSSHDASAEVWHSTPVKKRNADAPLDVGHSSVLTSFRMDSPAKPWAECTRPIPADAPCPHRSQDTEKRCLLKRTNARIGGREETADVLRLRRGTGAEPPVARPILSSCLETGEDLGVAVIEILTKQCGLWAGRRCRAQRRPSSSSVSWNRKSSTSAKMSKTLFVVWTSCSSRSHRALERIIRLKQNSSCFTESVCILSVTGEAGGELLGNKIVRHRNLSSGCLGSQRRPATVAVGLESAVSLREGQSGNGWQVNSGMNNLVETQAYRGLCGSGSLVMMKSAAAKEIVQVQQLFHTLLLRGTTGPLVPHSVADLLTTTSAGTEGGGFTIIPRLPSGGDDRLQQLGDESRCSSSSHTAAASYRTTEPLHSYNCQTSNHHHHPPSSPGQRVEEFHHHPSSCIHRAGETPPKACPRHGAREMCGWLDPD
ncbi:coiled-coil domain-containing protein 62 [Lates japonicus]|uniref:Coiled-coil domain-containing protein 62 n=1 Tax=Lates japonicus TaxID=270547 RepID=A0AAD3MNV1_LATJO|nr:coiled-coil domain-containing protein 62 [Lates japonicus]